MTRDLKLARELKPGDRILVSLKNEADQVATVLAVIEAEQTIKRAVIALTLLTAEGVQVTRQSSPNRTVRVVPTPPQGGD